MPSETISSDEMDTQGYVAAAGMSLRDFFAAAALAGGADSATSAYKTADDMIAEGDKER